jgi:hypothetical protein
MGRTAMKPNTGARYEIAIDGTPRALPGWPLTDGPVSAEAPFRHRNSMATRLMPGAGRASFNFLRVLGADPPAGRSRKIGAERLSGGSK